MEEMMVDAKQIKRIVEKTLETIEKSKNEIYDIVENARAEVERVKLRLKEIQEKTASVIDEVDKLEVQDKLMRKKLVQVSKEFDRFTEHDIKDVYEQASEIRAQFYLKQQEEKNLRAQREELEQSLKKARYILNSAEKLISQVGIAMNYLSSEVNDAVIGENGEEAIYLGIKVLEAQEEERRRLSRDIHDGPAQSIANIVLKAEICRTLMEKNIPEGLKELEELKKSVRSTLQDIRKIIYDLRPMSIDDLGIIPTLRRFAQEFSEKTGLKVLVETAKLNSDVEKIIQIAVFRLVQELFNNVEKHAKCSEVTLELAFGIKYLSLEVSDNGAGFDFEEALEKAHIEQKSFGLIGLIERVEQLHGQIHYNSQIGRGTKVVIKIPVNREVMRDEFQHYKNTDS